jgi:hypothetical protein
MLDQDDVVGGDTLGLDRYRRCVDPEPLATTKDLATKVIVSELGHQPCLCAQAAQGRERGRDRATPLQRESSQVDPRLRLGVTVDDCEMIDMGFADAHDARAHALFTPRSLGAGAPAGLSPAQQRTILEGIVLSYQRPDTSDVERGQLSQPVAGGKPLTHGLGFPNTSPMAKRNKSSKRVSDALLADIKRMLTADELSEAADAVAAGSSWARAVLDGGRPALPESLDEGVPEALIGLLSERQDADALGWLAGHKRASKLAKAARTAAHRLRSKGVEVVVTITTEDGVEVPVELEAEKSLISQYDGRGQRIVWLAQSETRGLMLHRARVSWRGGLLELKTGSTTRREYRNVLRDLEQRELMTARCDEAAASWLLQAAARQTKALGRGLPEGYLLASRLLTGRRDAPHPGLAVEPDASELLELYERPELFIGWMPEEDAMQQLALKLQEVATSTILVDEAQRRQRATEVLEAAAAEHFATERAREDTRRFMLDAAHLLALREQPQDAARLRAAADLFEAADVVDHPFALRFFERFIDLSKVVAGPQAHHHHHHDHDGPCDHPDHQHEPEGSGDGGLIVP